MPLTFDPFKNHGSFHYSSFFHPVLGAFRNMPQLKSKGNRPLQMSFEDHLNALIYFHLQEHTSAQHLLQVLEQNEFARNNIAPEKGIKKSSFSEATNERGLEQFLHVYKHLQAQAVKILPNQCPELGDLVAIDGSLIEATLSMYWADYRKNDRKAKVHVGFNLNKGVPQKVHLTDGKAGERPFVDPILAEGQTAVMDRGYQSHALFDQLHRAGKFYVCRIGAKTRRKILETHPVSPESIVFSDALVLLGSQSINQSEQPLRLIGYKVNGIKYWIATNRFDLSAEQIAQAYKLRWAIESFFGWWKQHLKVYHLITRSYHGLMVQVLAGLITYLLLAIYCHEQFNESVTIKRVRELRINIENDLGFSGNAPELPDSMILKELKFQAHAKT